MSNIIHILITGIFCLSLTVVNGQKIETCNNAIDDDQDGFIDLNDPECVCDVIEPISRIPNPSFEELQCCPSSRSQLVCATGWNQASEATTDLIHTCGWQGWPQFAPPRPFPDGEGIVGFRDGRRADNNGNIDYAWKEYAGACLTGPLLKDEQYRFEFYIGFVNTSASPVLDLTLYGTNSCEYLPFGKGDAEFGCPTNSPEWREMTSVRVGWNHGWIKSEFNFTPTEDIYSIAIGPSCANTSATQSTYYYLDKLVLDELSNFTWAIGEKEHRCNNAFELFVQSRPGFSYQWYKNGIALIGETGSSIKNIGEGRYQVRIHNAEECFTTGVFNYQIPVIEKEVEVRICEDESYSFGGNQLNEAGEYMHAFQSRDGCDSIVLLDLVIEETIVDTVYARIFSDEKYKVANQSFEEEGEHYVIGEDENGCQKEIYLFLEYYDVYWPNIFSPNGDGHNDYFMISGGRELIEIKDLRIYNRWGGQVYQASNLDPNENFGWNGMDGSQKINGVYVFKAVVVMQNGIEKALFGSVMVI